MNTPASQGGRQQGILSLTLKDSAEVHQHFMPFVEGGGLFVPTTKRYNLGDEVFLLVTLQSENESMPIPGRVCWITPVGAQGSRRAGIGIAFDRSATGSEVARTKFETLIAAYGHKDEPTLTM